MYVDPCLLDAQSILAGGYMSEPAATQSLGVAHIMEIGGHVLEILPIAIPKLARSIPQDPAGCAGRVSNVGLHVGPSIWDIGCPPATTSLLGLSLRNGQATRYCLQTQRRGVVSLPSRHACQLRPKRRPRRSGGASEQIFDLAVPVLYYLG